MLPHDPDLVPVCAIGASAGGVAALQELFRSLEPDLGLAYVVVVHLSPEHPSALHEILGAATRMPVRQVQDSPRLEPDCVYVIPPDRELTIEGDDVAARPFVEKRGRRAPIDMFFRSVAMARGDGMAVILTGGGTDGTLGARAVKEAGGVVFVQDPAEAEFPMMPRSAVAAGLADFVGSVALVAKRIAEAARSKEALRGLTPEGAESELRRVLAFLRARTGHDFAGYKRATIMRRVARRMQVNRCGGMAEYVRHLRDTPEETQQLFSDLLISVTSFFRDPAAFDVLADRAVAPIFDRLRPADEGVRAWTAGCATGEEAYSLAIVMLEETSRRKLQVAIQIFATDLDEGSLATAREGVYPRTIEADVSEERLRRWFVREGNVYRVRKEVRDVVLFTTHSVVKDPPFMRLDLIVCRNLLIYLERELQRQVLQMFHYVLRPDACVFLGSAETVESTPDLFLPIDRDARLYRMRQQAMRRLPPMPQLVPDVVQSAEHRRHSPRPEADAVAAVHAAALEKVAPPSVLVDRDLRVLHLSPTAGRFLMPSAGPFTSEVTALVRPEMRTELRIALHAAFDGDGTALVPTAPVGFDGGRRRVAVHVSRVAADDGEGARALVVFLDGGPAPEIDGADEDGDRPEEVKRLQAELQSAQDRLAASRREHEMAVQELRAANEELQSINEEYRSTSEELETSKEELQSMNEELQTVNAELKAKLESISSAHSDLQNLVAATEIGTLFLDLGMRIRMFTPQISVLFNVTEADTGRSIGDFTHHLRYDGLKDEATAVLRDLQAIEKEVEAEDGRRLSMRMRPYRTIEDRIDGVVVTFMDVTPMREAIDRLSESEERYRTLFESMGEGMLVAEPLPAADGRGRDLLCVTANPAAQSMLPPEFVGRRLTAVADGFDERWASIPARVLETGRPERAELPFAPSGKWFEVFVWKAERQAGRVAMLLRDTTERRRAEETQKLLLGELNHRVKNMLTVVQSVAMQTQRTAASPEDFIEAFDDRLQALARAHELLAKAEWTHAELGELARGVLDAFDAGDGGRIRIKGPPARLTPGAAIALGMALQELGANAAKHGALSSPGGRAELVWRIEEDGSDARLVLDWREIDGPTVRPPTRRGFGTRMLTEGVAAEVGGTVDLRFPPGGAECTMRMPLGGRVLRA
jgi:two-component system CheB/CheR fusion protein